jgi:hypothetical protein
VIISDKLCHEETLKLVATLEKYRSACLRTLTKVEQHDEGGSKDGGVETTQGWCHLPCFR